MVQVYLVKTLGTDGSPLQYDDATYTINGVAGTVGGSILSATNNGIYTTLSTNTTYNNVKFYSYYIH